MTKRIGKQRELPLLTNVNSSAGSTKSEVSKSDKSQLLKPDYSGFHKPASDEDQSIYQSISDRYFKKQN